MELRQEQDIDNQHIDILIELEEHLSQLQCKVSRVWNPWKTCKSCTKFVFRVSPKTSLSFNEKTRKLYIGKPRWRRQEQWCDAVISPPNTSSDGLDLLMTAYVTPSATTVFYSLCLDAVKSTRWRLHALFQHRNLRLCRFLHFYAPKTSEMASFPEFTLQVPKITKGTI